MLQSAQMFEQLFRPTFILSALVASHYFKMDHYLQLQKQNSAAIVATIFLFMC
jgi:hypothetical protein